ncbi:MAG: DUF4129 domain-containing protein [Acidimicrobiales bacterium]
MSSWPGRSSTGHRGPTAALFGGLAVVVLLLVLASTSGVVHVWSEPPAGSGSVSTEVDATVPPDGPGVSQGKLPAATSTDGDGWWIRVIAVVVAVVVLRVAIITVRFWWDVFRGRQRRERAPDAPAFPVLDAPPQHVDVRLDLVAQTAALADGEARNAIVRCWLLLEDDVAAAGMPRRAAETTVEYTGRVLGAALVDPAAAAAVTELAELYREARFSRHELDDDRRERALTALRSIHAALRPVDTGAVT